MKALTNKQKNILGLVLAVIFLIIAVLVYIFYLSPALKYRSAYQSLGEGDWQQAEEEILALIDQGYNDPELHNNLSVVYRNLREFDKALEQADKALELDAEFKEAYFNRGRAFKFFGKTEKSLAAYEKALQIDPDYEEALKSACETSYMLYLTEKVERYCSQTLILDPENREALLIFGLYHLSKENYNMANTFFDDLVELEPDSSLYWYFKGICQYGLRLDDEAIESFKKAHELSPKFDEAQQMLEKLGVTEGGSELLPEIEEQ